MALLSINVSDMNSFEKFISGQICLKKKSLYINYWISSDTKLLWEVTQIHLQYDFNQTVEKDVLVVCICYLDRHEKHHLDHLITPLSETSRSGPPSPAADLSALNGSGGDNCCPLLWLKGEQQLFLLRYRSAPREQTCFEY